MRLMIDPQNTGLAPEAYRFRLRTSKDNEICIKLLCGLSNCRDYSTCLRYKPYGIAEEALSSTFPNLHIGGCSESGVRLAQIPMFFRDVQD